MKKIIRIMGLLVISLITFMVCLSSLEIMLRFINPEPNYWWTESSAGWEERWLMESNNRDSNKTNYIIDKFHPLLGWTLMNNLNNVSLNSGIVNSNSQGIRGTKEYSFKKGDKIRLLTLGDSFTFGECVNDDETFSAYLENLCENCEVINMGVHGYGNDQQLLKLKTEGLKYEPDIIILGFFSPDINRNKFSFRDYLKPRFFLRNGNLSLQTTHIMSPEEFKKNFHLKTINHLRIVLDRIFAEKIEKENIEVSYKIFEQMLTESRSINSTLVFVYLPQDPEVINNKSAPDSLFSQMCNNKNLICIDPTSGIHNFLIDKEDPLEYFKCHYSPEIHYTIAAQIYDSLKPLFS